MSLSQNLSFLAINLVAAGFVAGPALADSWYAAPAITQSEAAYAQAIRDKDDNLATMFDSRTSFSAASTPLRQYAKRWNNTSTRWEEWTGSAWQPLGGSSPWAISISGSAPSWTTGRTFSLTGDATGTSAAVTGAANASIPVTLADTGVIAPGGGSTVSAGPAANAVLGYGATFNVPRVTMDTKGRATVLADRVLTLPSMPTQAQVCELVWQVGSVYINAANTTNPATLLGCGSWTEIGAGRVLVGQDTGNSVFDVLGETGGSANAVVVAHSHSITDVQHSHSESSYALGNGASSGSGRAGVPQGSNTGSSFTGITGTNSTGVSGVNANLQPYIVVKMWVRTS